MENNTSLESEIANLLRVYRARREVDLAQVMTTLQKVAIHAKSLEERLDALEGRRYVEDRSSYLAIKQ